MAIGIRHPQDWRRRPPQAAARHRIVGVGQLEQGDAAIAERQRQPVVLWRIVQRGDAEAMRHLQHCAHAELICELDGRDVVRIGQRHAQRDGAVKLLVVVAGRVGVPPGVRVDDRGVVDH